MKRAVLMYLLLTCCLFVLPNQALAISVTTANAATDTCFAASTTCAVTISASVGDTVCMATDVDASTRTMSVADSSGSNTYTPAATIEIVGSKEGWIHCSLNIGSAITSVTATVSSTIAGNSHAVAWVVSSARTTAYTPNQNAATCTSCTGALHTTNSVTYGGSGNSAFLGFSAHNGTGTFTIDGTFTSDYSGVGGVFGHLIASSSSTMTNSTAGIRTSVSMMVEIQGPASAAETFGFRLRVIQ